MDNTSLSTMEEIKQLFNSVVTAKLQLVNDFTKIVLQENGISNELTDRMVQLSTEPNQFADSGNFSNNQSDQQQSTSNVTIDKQQIIEQFQSDGNLDIKSQQIIVNDMNQYLACKNIRILYDDAHSTWVCLNKQRIRLKLFTPVNSNHWSKDEMTQNKLVKKINDWLPTWSPSLKYPFEKLELTPCCKSRDPATQFLFVLLFAFGLALDFGEAIFNPLGDKSTDTVRKIIGDALLNGLEKEISTIKAIWNY